MRSKWYAVLPEALRASLIVGDHNLKAGLPPSFLLNDLSLIDRTA
jgi:hypothetical protein